MIQLIRDKSTENAILGKIYLNGAFVCYSMESKSKAIPCGEYNVENSISPKFKRELPLLSNYDVKASRGIRIHVCNKPEDVIGCVGVGMGRNCDTERLTESKIAENMMVAICRNNYTMVISEI